MPEHEISNSAKVFFSFYFISLFFFFFYKNLKVPQVQRFQRFRGHPILSLVTPNLDGPPDI